MTQFNFTPQQMQSERMKLTLLISQLKNKIELGKMKDLAELALHLSVNKDTQAISMELGRRLKLNLGDQNALQEILRALQLAQNNP